MHHIRHNNNKTPPIRQNHVTLHLPKAPTLHNSRVTHVTSKISLYAYSKANGPKVK